MIDWRVGSESLRHALRRAAGSGRDRQTPSRPWHRKTTVIAALSVAAILAHLALRFGFHTTPTTSRIPLLITLAIGGVPLMYDLIRKLLKREFGSDLLGGISIITSVLLGEYLAGSIIVLMLAEGRRWRATPSQRLLGAGRAGQADAVSGPPETGF